MSTRKAAGRAEMDFAGSLAQAEAKMASKAKPIGSLGVLEALACRLAALQGTTTPHVGRASLLVFGADHGISAACPEVSAFPRAVSAPVFRAIVRGQAASAVLCNANDCSALLAVDVGLDADVTDAWPTPQPSVGAGGKRTRILVMHRKVRAEGSRNMLEGPAMTEEEMRAAMLAGAEAVQAAVRGVPDIAPHGGVLPPAAGLERAATRGDTSYMQNGTDSGRTSAVGDRKREMRERDLPPDWRQCVICLGEVGIGNTTSAAALLAALTGALPEDVCGRGTGVGDAGLATKQWAVAQALQANSDLLGPGAGALEALRAVGGLELSAMAGAVLEAARLGLPVVVDGFISGAAALAALAHSPECVGRVLILSHRSAERGASLLLSALLGTVPLLRGGPRKDGSSDGDGNGGRSSSGPEQSGAVEADGAHAAAVRPTPAVLDMSLRLGEGTGAVLVLPLLRSAAAIMSEMATLEEVVRG